MPLAPKLPPGTTEPQDGTWTSEPPEPEPPEPDDAEGRGVAIAEP